MKSKKVIIPLFLLSAMLFIGVSIYMAGKKHIVKVEENNVLNQENADIKNQNCSLKNENVKLKHEVKALKNEIQLRDSIQDMSKLHKNSVVIDKPNYIQYRIFTNQISDSSNSGE